MFFAHASSSDLYCLAASSGDEAERVDVGAPISWSSEAAPWLALVLGTTGTADLGPLCTADFKVSAGVAGVCKEVAHFAASSYVGELFWSIVTAPISVIGI